MNFIITRTASVLNYNYMTVNRCQIVVVLNL